MAGLPLADVVFALAFSRILLVIDKTLKDKFGDTLLRSWLFKQVAYADDLAVPVIAEVASEVAPLAVGVVVQIYNVFTSYSMTPNLKLGNQESVSMFISICMFPFKNISIRIIENSLLATMVIIPIVF